VLHFYDLIWKEHIEEALHEVGDWEESKLCRKLDVESWGLPEMRKTTNAAANLTSEVERMPSGVGSVSPPRGAKSWQSMSLKLEYYLQSSLWNLRSGHHGLHQEALFVELSDLSG